MSDADPTTDRKRYWKTQILIALFLLGLGLIGLGLLDFAPKPAEWYWLIALPIYAGMSIYIGYAGAKRRGENPRLELKRQALHWLGFFLALKLLFILLHAGTIERNALGLVTLILLALTCYQAGIHFEPAFLVVGVFLAIAVACAAYLEEYLFIILAIMLLVMAMLIVQILSRRNRSAAE